MHAHDGLLADDLLVVLEQLDDEIDDGRDHVFRDQLCRRDECRAALDVVAVLKIL